MELANCLRGLARSPHECLLALALRYGTMVSLPYPLEAVVLVSDPTAIEYIFHYNHRNYTKQTARYSTLADVMGEGLFSIDGDVWRKQRQRIQPAFHQERLAHFEQAVMGELGTMLAQWRRHASAGTPVSLYQELLRMSLRAIVKAMFGGDIRDVVAPTLAAFETAHRFINPVSFVNLMAPPRAVRRVLAPGFRSFERALRLLNEVIDGIVRDRGRDHVDTGDLLSMLLASRDEEAGEAMTARQVRDEVMTMFMAGHETGALGLTWTLYLLSLHPSIRRELQAEVHQVLAGRDPTIQDLPKLTFTKWVIEESMRLYPPAWGVDRRTVQSDVVAGYKIPAGTTIAISMYVVHRLPQFWRNPEGFDPHRFSPEESQGRPAYAYFPFGGGPRRCVGMRFANAQMQLVLASIVQQFDLDLAPGPAVAPQARLNFSPSRDIFVTPRDLTPATA